MGKKDKKHSLQTDRAAPRKHSEFTSLGLALLEAAAKKNKDTSLSSSKNDRVYIPPPVVPKKQPIILQQQPVTKKIDPPRSAPAVDQKKPNIKLGLRREPDEKLVLSIGTSKGGNQNRSPIISQKIDKVHGRAQVHDGHASAESNIVIGFDFGTSSSKIVIRDSVMQTAYAVPFGSLACSGNAYFIPTSICLSDNGEICLSAGEYSYADLKIHLMDNPEQCLFKATNTSQMITASELSAAYMALVIRFARDWFLKHTEAIYKKTHIQWHINLGIPSKNYDDQRKRKTFQTIAMAAWRISRIDAAITIADVKNSLEGAVIHIAKNGKDIDMKDNESPWLHPDYVNSHPEVIMEVVGYARSPLRSNGLHLLIDVGASTLDAATFRFHSQDGEDVYPLLETNVERLGTMMLHNRRIETLKNNLQKILRQKQSIDPTSPLPDSADYEMLVGEDDLSENDENFFKECRVEIVNVIKETKSHRDPYSGAWEKGLPVFICGGGGKVHQYQEMIKKLGSSLKANTEIKGFDIKTIPKPDQLEAPDLPHQEYGRLAVAYGLSYTSFEIGEIIPESKISDIHQKVEIQNIEDRFVSKDMC